MKNKLGERTFSPCRTWSRRSSCSGPATSAGTTSRTWQTPYPGGSRRCWRSRGTPPSVENLSFCLKTWWFAVKYKVKSSTAQFLNEVFFEKFCRWNLIFICDVLFCKENVYYQMCSQHKRQLFCFYTTCLKNFPKLHKWKHKKMKKVMLREKSYLLTYLYKQSRIFFLVSH
jgi:hypothetical protein